MSISPSDWYPENIFGLIWLGKSLRPDLTITPKMHRQLWLALHRKVKKKEEVLALFCKALANTYVIEKEEDICEFCRKLFDGESIWV